MDLFEKVYELFYFSDDPEELVIPGDASELSDFANYSMKNSYIQIQCDLPIVSLQLKFVNYDLFFVVKYLNMCYMLL